jgi:hypothetical protein
MTQFITATELKAYPLPVTDKQWEKVSDPQIDTILGYASQNIEDYLDRHIMSAYYTERLPGLGRPSLMVEETPLTALASVSERDVYENATALTVSDMIIDSGAGIIAWKDRVNKQFYKNYYYVVTYLAGYSTVPGPVKHATALQAIEMLQPLFRGGTNFVQVDLIEGLNEQIVDQLERYRRKRIG